MGRDIRPFIAIGGALGVAETLTGASLGALAEAWAAAPAADRAGYLAAYDAVGFATTSIDFGAIVILALFLGMLGAAILASQTYARWIGWACLSSGALTLGGILVELAIPDALWAIFAAQLLLIAATIAMGRAIWRQADRLEDPGPHVAPANLVMAAPEGD